MVGMVDQYRFMIVNGFDQGGINLFSGHSVYKLTQGLITSVSYTPNLPPAWCSSVSARVSLLISCEKRAYGSTWWKSMPRSTGSHVTISTTTAPLSSMTADAICNAPTSRGI